MFGNHLLRKGKRFGQSMHRGRPMGESFDHGPAGWIRQSRKRCALFIHNLMIGALSEEVKLPVLSRPD